MYYAVGKNGPGSVLNIANFCGLISCDFGFPLQVAEPNPNSYKRGISSLCTEQRKTFKFSNKEGIRLAWTILTSERGLVDVFRALKCQKFAEPCVCFFILVQEKCKTLPATSQTLQCFEEEVNLE